MGACQFVPRLKIKIPPLAPRPPKQPTVAVDELGYPVVFQSFMEDELATVDYEGSERSALTTPRSCTTPRSLFGDLTPRTARSFLDDQDAELLAAAAAVEPLPAGHQAISKQAKGLVVAASPVDTANVKGAKATPKAKPKAKPKVPDWVELFSHGS